MYHKTHIIQGTTNLASKCILQQTVHENFNISNKPSYTSLRKSIMQENISINLPNSNWIFYKNNSKGTLLFFYAENDPKENKFPATKMVKFNDMLFNYSFFFNFI